MRKNEIQCPVDFVSMNENKARLAALFVLLLATVFLITGLWYIMALLVVDFLLRANNLGKYSLLAILSDAVIKQLKIKNKPTDRAPKRFAAGVGLVFTIGILMLTLLHLDTATLLVTLVLALFAFLESFVGFCAGCYVYSMLQKLANTFKNNQLKQ
jgi:bifunctional ADP-heptose synthase (sugar kinase/adenylyltransferase)